MANPEHLAKLMEGREAWNRWREETAEDPDLSGASLRGLDLSGFALDDTDLSGADLDGVVIRNTVAEWVNVVGARWTNARVADCHFRYFRARDSNFDGAHLFGTSFHYCDFPNASFLDTDLILVVFTMSDLRDLRHFKPKRADISIGIDTFFESGGLPEEILRAANLPDEFITYARSLTGTAIEFYSCFISYSSKDDDFTRRLHADLQARKIKTWFAPEDLKIGDRFHSRIDESIRIHDKLVLILSEHSMESDWVRREVEAAREREDREKKDILFPIRLDDAIFASSEAWAAEIRRSKHIGDFRSWKSHDDYTKALDRLVKDLKKEGPIIMR